MSWEKTEDDKVPFEIMMLRKHLGLETLEFKTMQCRRLIEVQANDYQRCKRTFAAQFKGNKQVTMYCTNCRYHLEQMDRSTIGEIHHV